MDMDIMTQDYYSTVSLNMKRELDEYRKNEQIIDEVKNGKVAKYMGERDTPEYWEFRNKTIERDSGCCRICNKELWDKLNVHHIKSYARCPSLRYSVSNAISLCKPCHKMFHRIYGTKSFPVLDDSIKQSILKNKSYCQSQNSKVQKTPSKKSQKSS
jgi:5-methylcytosine-specific restriction endonuclease McrA